MTEVDALKARIVELERQSVKALEGLMKANDRLLASTKLQRWGDDKPDVGRAINIYPREHDYGFWARTYELDGKIVIDGPETIPMQSVNVDTRWCYVADAPDWDKP